jgi:hypothetical protein
MKSKIRGWTRQIRTFKFISHCLVQVDIDLAMRIFSKQVQSDSALIIDYGKFRASYKRRLARLQGRLGATARARVAELAMGEWSFSRRT